MKLLESLPKNQYLMEIHIIKNMNNKSYLDRYIGIIRDTSNDTFLQVSGLALEDLRYKLVAVTSLLIGNSKPLNVYIPVNGWKKES